MTKRDLFYTDVKLFKDQKDSDAVLDDISCLLGCTRNSLHVVASEKGVVVGRLRYKEDGDDIDCTKMGVGGKAIPSNVDKGRSYGRTRSLFCWWRKMPRSCDWPRIGFTTSIRAL